MDRVEERTEGIEAERLRRPQVWALGEQCGFAQPTFSVQPNMGCQSHGFMESQPHLAD